MLFNSFLFLVFSFSASQECIEKDVTALAYHISYAAKLHVSFANPLSIQTFHNESNEHRPAFGMDYVN